MGRLPQAPLWPSAQRRVAEAECADWQVRETRFRANLRARSGLSGGGPMAVQRLDTRHALTLHDIHSSVAPSCLLFPSSSRAGQLLPPDVLPPAVAAPLPSAPRIARKMGLCNYCSAGNKLHASPLTLLTLQMSRGVPQTRSARSSSPPPPQIQS